MKTILILMAFCSVVQFSNAALSKKISSNKKQKKDIEIINSTVLSEELKETSGLIYYDDYLYTHNDDSDTYLYKLEPNTCTIVKRIPLTFTKNYDWEAITQDEFYIYIGDFGNNGTGTRSNLTIYKILKKSLVFVPEIEIITFDYEGRKPQKTQKANATNYDCEGFIAHGDSLFLFTKEWLTEQSTLYTLPKKSGNHLAKKRFTYEVNGLITDATYHEKLDKVILTGYSSTLQPFLYTIKNFSNINPSLHRTNRYKVGLPFHQIEGITFAPNNLIYCSNEQFKRKFIANVPQMIHTMILND